MRPPTSPAASDDEEDRIDITWTASLDDADSYEIARSATSGSGFSTIATVSGAITGFTDYDVTQGESWYYKIRACKTGVYAGCSEYSSETLGETIGDIDLIAINYELYQVNSNCGVGIIACCCQHRGYYVVHIPRPVPITWPSPSVDLKLTVITTTGQQVDLPYQLTGGSGDTQVLASTSFAGWSPISPAATGTCAAYSPAVSAYRCTALQPIIPGGMPSTCPPDFPSSPDTDLPGVVWREASSLSIRDKATNSILYSIALPPECYRRTNLQRSSGCTYDYLIRKVRQKIV
jgi:hypothetical protein